MRVGVEPMAESISSAKALHTFFSTLPKPAKNRSVATLGAISEKYAFLSNSVECFELIHTQRANLLELIQLVDATDWPKETKLASRSHLTDLFQAIDHAGLSRDWQDIYSKYVAPNISSLLILEQTLQIRAELAEGEEEELYGLADKFQALAKEVEASKLPLKLRTKINANLSVLVLLLKNYKAVGVTRAWEVASSTLLALSMEAQSHPDQSSPTLKNVMKTLSGGLGVLALLNGYVREGSAVVTVASAAFKAIGALFIEDQKLLEHKPIGESGDAVASLSGDAA